MDLLSVDKWAYDFEVYAILDVRLTMPIKQRCFGSFRASERDDRLVSAEFVVSFIRLDGFILGYLYKKIEDFSDFLNKVQFHFISWVKFFIPHNSTVFNPVE